MTTVFVLTHAHELDGCDEVKCIGIYSSMERAQAALDLVKDQPGFKDLPEGFEINEDVLDRTSWAEGFVTIRHGIAE
jgi:homoserine kinase type II